MKAFETITKLALVFITLINVTVLAATRTVPAQYPTIQAAIGSSLNGDTVIVWPGVYEENVNFGSLNIALGSLYFTTGDSSFISVTIIDGDSIGPVITISYGQDSTSLICGFTIRHGFAANGGGIYCDSSASPIISNNRVIENSAGGYGGGIFCSGSYNRISNNYIAFNTAKMGGGGLCLWNCYSLVTENDVANNVQVDTAIHGGGGGICCYLPSRPHIIRNRIHDNLAYGGGGLWISLGMPVVDSNIIYANRSFMDGSGIHLDNDSTIISNNIIKNNNGLPQRLNRGGGIFLNNSQSTIVNNIVEGNACNSSGGGISGWTAINLTTSLTGNLIINNSSGSNGGGIIFSDRYNLTLSNNTIIGNSAVSRGGGAYCSCDSVYIYNTIIRSNTAPQAGPEIVINPTTENTIVSHSNIQGGWPGDGNIDCDPFFCDPDNGDYHLAENSCCATAGDSGQYIGALGIGCESPACNYLPGDINSDGQRIGGDVTYGVRYFKSIGPQPPDSCFMDSTSTYLYVAGDVNGNCEFRGSDITRLVSFFKGNATLSCCHFFPTAP